MKREVTQELTKVNAYEVEHIPVVNFLEWVLGNPFFQRGLSWKVDGEVGLYQTISKLEPIPSFVVGRTPDGKLWLIDGQQRTQALRGMLRTLSGLPKAVELINSYLLTVQIVNGTLEELQSLFVRVNTNSGLTTGAKVAGSLKGVIGDIKTEIRNNPTLVKAFEKTSKGKIGDLSFEKIQSGNIIEVSLFLTSVEVFGLDGLTTNSKECGTALTATNITLPQATSFYVERSQKRIEALCLCLENISLRKNIKGNLAFLSIIYLLSDIFTVRQIIDGFNSMFDTNNKGIDKTMEFSVKGISMKRTYNEMFGAGVTNTYGKSLEKYHFVLASIKAYQEMMTSPKGEVTDIDAMALLAMAGRKA